MTPRFIQIDCRETNTLDARQAIAVLRHKPDIVFLEYPCDSGKPKPISDFSGILAGLKRTARSDRWVTSDVAVWKNVAKLHKKGHRVLVYKVDAPRELIREWREVWKNMYPCAVKNWLWWVKIYVRERFMANNISQVLEHYRGKEHPTVLVFLQSFHWQHVKFLLKNPAPGAIWKYYFSSFTEVSPSDILRKIGNENRVFYKYWRRCGIL